MLKHHHVQHKPKQHLINKLIFVVACLQPLGSLPQAISIYSRQDARGIALLTWFIYLAFDILWLWYGIVNKQRAIIISASLFTILESLVTIGAIMYGASLF